MLQLVKPSAQYKSSYLAAVRESQATGNGLGDTLIWNLDEISADFEQVLQHLARFEPPAELPAGYVHAEYRWLVDGDEYLGRVSIRHALNEHLRESGGHIGYEIRPSQQRKGYGTLILQLALERAQELGLQRVLITCDADNFGSRGVIENNGGVLEGEFRVAQEEKPVRRYWIDL